MKTKSIRTNKRGRLRISAKTSEKWFERMNSTQTSEETEVTNTERETRGEDSDEVLTCGEDGGAYQAEVCVEIQHGD